MATIRNIATGSTASVPDTHVAAMLGSGWEKVGGKSEKPAAEPAEKRKPRTPKE